MTNETEQNTRQSGHGQSEPKLLPIHYANALEQVNKQMLKDGIKAELEAYNSTGIHLVLYGVTMENGEFKEVRNVDE